MPHASFVYSAKIMPQHLLGDAKDQMVIVATACFDQKVRLWRVSTKRGSKNMYKTLHVVSIMHDPSGLRGPKASIYDASQLDDEALALIMRPERRIDYTKKTQVAGKSAKVTQIEREAVKVPASGTIFDMVHPNCLAFSEEGRLFVGDSAGRVSVWDVVVDARLQGLDVRMENHFKVTHKELEGDQINQVILHPEDPSLIFV